jgi:hypothetical protein
MLVEVDTAPGVATVGPAVAAVVVGPFCKVCRASRTLSRSGETNEKADVTPKTTSRKTLRNILSLTRIVCETRSSNRRREGKERGVQRIASAESSK